MTVTITHFRYHPSLTPLHFEHVSLPGPPAIPVRTSSKRVLDRDIEDDLGQKRSVERDIEARRKRIKAKGSFDATYWAGHKEVAALELKRHQLVRKISMKQFLGQGGEDEAWSEQDTAGTLREEGKALEMKNRILAEHIERMTFPRTDEARQHRTWVMELLTATPVYKGGIGAGGCAGQGPRDSSAQSNFRKKLENACNSKHPDASCNLQWCPITSSWVLGSAIRAAHIFPYSAGQRTMDQLFGRDDNDREELFEPENGLMMLADAEKRIENGWMVLVPDVPIDATTAQLDTWSKVKVKEYKQRVLCPENANMKQYIDQIGGRVWNDLDGQRVQFKSDHRPRARYLYWKFAVALLRKAWQSAHRPNNLVAAELGEEYWGIGGPWIRRKYLLAFAEYLGHAVGWENLLEAAAEPEDDDNEPDPGGLVVAVEQIRKNHTQVGQGLVRRGRRRRRRRRRRLARGPDGRWIA
ncbi:hypothetical protein JMJ35_004310 [Cladonia borealis]|uniref:HNH nuclease domain-containing protein n=1 Tax=Cladonia borealis TaxID=184061 RepID=A0AA39R3U7_9LECA|nr:hypothetical protein JMJ35_004310 [Cladonia borealis]